MRLKRRVVNSIKQSPNLGSLLSEPPFYSKPVYFRVKPNYRAHKNVPGNQETLSPISAQAVPQSLWKGL